MTGKSAFSCDQIPHFAADVKEMSPNTKCSVFIQFCKKKLLFGKLNLLNFGIQIRLHKGF